MEKTKRLNEMTKKIGTRHTRKLRKFSDGFNEKFTFFVKANRSGILTFCGDQVDVMFDLNTHCAKECFRLYDDGYYKNSDITSRHPNILKSAIIGKKAWGLWLDQYAIGIAEWSFTKDEILKEFSDKNIIIPDAFLLDFENRIKKYRLKIYESQRFS